MGTRSTATAAKAAPKKRNATLQLIEHDEHVHEVRLTTDSRTSSMSVLAISDVHFDSTKCDRKRLIRDLKWAQSEGAVVAIFGDFFDFMQGRYDPRGNKSAVRPEHKVDNYVDAVIEDAADFLAKYCTNVLVTRGNHETNLLKRLETDVTKRLVSALKERGVNALSGEYNGWVIFSIQRLNTEIARAYASYHHGAGGNAPRSKGVLGVDINQKENPDADIVFRGHDHNKWLVPQTVRRLNMVNKKMVRKIVRHVQLGSYKMMSEKSGWEQEKGFGEPTLGGWKIVLSQAVNGQGSLKVSIYDTEDAIIVH